MQNSYTGKFLHVLVALTASIHFSSSLGQAADSLTYTKDILPIFTSTCLDCHGPDEG